MVSGALPAGLELTEDGRLRGVPGESGTFAFTVRINHHDGTAAESAYRISVSDNTDGNLDANTDAGYELTEQVPDLYLEDLPEEGDQRMVSVGSYEEFIALYLDGEMLVRDTDYTAEPGSTRITILNQTLRRNGPGKHTLAMEFRAKDTGALKWAAQNYVIEEKREPSEDDNGSTGNTSGEDTETSPEEGMGDISSTIAYTVKHGDTLSKLAQRFYGSGSSWRRIYTDNAAAIRNPNRIYPGQVLLITLDQGGRTAGETAAANPETGNAGLTTSYTVAAGDNLYKISYKVYGTGGRWNEIYLANKKVIANPGRIYAGQVLRIPLNGKP